MMHTISAHFVKRGRVGGAEHMLYNLINGLTDLQVRLNVLANEPIDLGDDLKILATKRSEINLAYANGRGPRFVQEQMACWLPSAAGESILFPNYFTPPLIPRRCGRILTVIHDLQYLHFPAYFSAKKRLWLKFAHALTLERADKVIVISEFVRDDILRYYGEKHSRKVAVIHNPVSWERFGAPTAIHPLDGKPYLLSVAAQYPHKNLDTAIKAFAAIAKKLPDVQFILAGQVYEALSGVPSRQANLRALISEYGLDSRVRIIGYVDESMQEVTLGQAIYIENPYAADEWAAKILDVLRHPTLYRPTEAVQQGIRDRYAPRTIAQAYLALMSGTL
jgi:glycosyltransferase involved in cell wall biosynthesis